MFEFDIENSNTRNFVSSGYIAKSIFDTKLWSFTYCQFLLD